MQAILTACQTGRLDAAPVVVISNNPAAGALEYARQAGLPALHLAMDTRQAGQADSLSSMARQLRRERQAEADLFSSIVRQVRQVRQAVQVDLFSSIVRQVRQVRQAVQVDLFSSIVRQLRQVRQAVQVDLFSPIVRQLRQVRQAGLPALHLAAAAKARAEADQRLLQMLREHRADWVLLAGYLRPVGPQVLAAYQGRILNIHPGPLPEFGGKGMYGLHVHRAVLASGRPETAAVIHQVEEGYDTGPVLAERLVPVAADDTPEVLAARVLQTEHALYVDTLREILCGKLLVL